ncbi:hypothetical protein MHYP_G00333910 [Metynnis hypsauchen]
MEHSYAAAELARRESLESLKSECVNLIRSTRLHSEIVPNPTVNEKLLMAGFFKTSRPLAIIAAENMAI